MSANIANYGAITTWQLSWEDEGVGGGDELLVSTSRARFLTSMPDDDKHGEELGQESEHGHRSKELGVAGLADGSMQYEQGPRPLPVGEGGHQGVHVGGDEDNVGAGEASLW